MAAVHEFNVEYDSWDWYTYLINAGKEAIETVLIVSKGFDDNRVTSILRHKLERLPANSYAKIEFVEESLLTLNNTFEVTFFIHGTLYDRKFIFPAGEIAKEKMTDLPVMEEKGILAG